MGEYLTSGYATICESRPTMGIITRSEDAVNVSLDLNEITVFPKANKVQYTGTQLLDFRLVDRQLTHSDAI